MQVAARRDSSSGFASLLLVPMVVLGADGPVANARTSIPKRPAPISPSRASTWARLAPRRKSAAQVIALGGGRFDAVIYTQGLPGAGWDGKTKVRLHGETSDNVAHLKGKNFEGTIKDGVFSGTAEDGVKFELKKVERKSPTLGATPPPGAIVLFDGKNTAAWQVGKIEDGNLLGVPAITKETFEDFLLHIEFRTPFMPRAAARGAATAASTLPISTRCRCSIRSAWRATTTSAAASTRRPNRSSTCAFRPWRGKPTTSTFGSPASAPTAKPRRKTRL